MIKTLSIGGIADTQPTDWHVLALDNDTTILWGFGRNTDAQIGNGGNSPQEILTPIEIPAVVNTTVFKVQAGGVHSIILGIYIYFDFAINQY